MISVIILGVVAAVCFFGCTPSLNVAGVQRITPRGRAWSHVYAMSWSPDGSELALAHVVGRVEGVTEGYLYVIGIEKRKPRILTLTTTNNGEVSEPAWSPTSNQIAFFTNGSDWDPAGIWLVRSDDTESPVFLLGGNSCAWNPDGERIAIADYSGYVIYVLNTRTGERQEVLRFFEEGHYASGGGISWASKGDRLAFAYGLADQKNLMSIYELDLETGESRLLIEGEMYLSPSWSPDGTMLAFSGGPTLLDQTLMIMRMADGSIIKPLDTGTGSIAWSPDGSKIAFEWEGAVYTMDTAIALEEWLKE